MLSGINKLFGQRSASQGVPQGSPKSNPVPQPARSQDRQQTYSKVFRWKLPQGHAQPPNSVEVVGSFTFWRRVALQRDPITNDWHATIDGIPGNKTHHYMILADGQPVHDRNSDGMVIPSGAEEERYQLITERGPRVFMLFAQAK